ncbi:MAG: sensor histidine kinase [Chthoniobacteraceae bacterium]
MKSVSEPRSLSTLPGVFEPIRRLKRGGLGRKNSGAVSGHNPVVWPAGDAKFRALVENGSDVIDSRQAGQSLRAGEQRHRLPTEPRALQYTVVQALAESTSITQAAPKLLPIFCAQLGCEAAALWIKRNDHSRLDLVHLHQHSTLATGDLFAGCRPAPIKEGHSLAGQVWEAKQPLSLDHLSERRGPAHHRAAARLRLRRAFAFPVMLAREVDGVVELFSVNSLEPERPQPDIFATVGIQMGLFMERTQALEQLRHSEEALIQVNNALERRVSARTAELHAANHELSTEIAERTRLEREIIRISEHEQRRIGQDLHDGVCQELAAIAFMTRALANRLDKNGSEETATIHRVARLLNDSISRCRDIARGLHPVQMDSGGLMVALRDLARSTHPAIACAFQCDEPTLMRESDTALNLYRIAQEAVNNALKYSHASRITISLRRDHKGLRLSISDDGCGIPIGPAARRGARNGMGLHIMRYRARSMGATLRIHDRRPRGTEVVCLLPPQ